MGGISSNLACHRISGYRFRAGSEGDRTAERSIQTNSPDVVGFFRDVRLAFGVAVLQMRALLMVVLAKLRLVMLQHYSNLKTRGQLRWPTYTTHAHSKHDKEFSQQRITLFIYGEDQSLFNEVACNTWPVSSTTIAFGNLTAILQSCYLASKTSLANIAPLAREEKQSISLFGIFYFQK